MGGEQRSVQIRIGGGGSRGVLELNIDGNRFVSANGEVAGRPFEISADAVIITSGGFQANEEWMARAWGKAAENFLIRGTPNNTGKPLASLINQGADTVGDPSQWSTNH